VLVTIGIVFMAVAAVTLLLVGWKAFGALRAAQRMMGGMSGYGGGGGSRRDPLDDDRIDGRWGNSDSP
jgi:hypothetical protein